jgi:GR25 family glycosyltransferase involved in LPS biosynthesis
MNEILSVYLINLDRSTDRLQRFRHRNRHVPNVIRVSAIDGSTLDRNALMQSGYITGSLSYPSGTLGCALSHIKLWEVAVSEGRSITVFEDDILVSHHFEQRARQVLSFLPEDWGFIQWGSTFASPSYIWVDFGISKATIIQYGNRRYQGAEGQRLFQTEDGFSYPVRLLHSFGFQGYSISAQAARAALEYCLPLRDRMIHFPEVGVTTPDLTLDIALSGFWPNLKAFICLPPLVISAEGEDSVRTLIDKE